MSLIFPLRLLAGAALGTALCLPSLPVPAAEPVTLTISPLPALPALPATADNRPDRLPDGIVAHGSKDIAAAWLTGPTERYRHGVLGDAIEASGLTVETQAGETLTLELGPESVFEDRYPRLEDLNGDGTDEIIIVRSYLAHGAALAVAGIRDSRLAILAETPPIGRPNRWLNPVGAADFDGDGSTEIAIVRTPHIGGTLILYRWRDGELTEAFKAHEFSNHAIGTRELGLSAILDADGDGIADIALPDSSRKVLRIVTFAGGDFRELARAEHSSPIASRIAVLGGEGNPRLAYALTDGSVLGVTFD